METPKTPESCNGGSSTSIELGLKALTICCSENDEKHHNSCLMTSNPFPPPISSPSYSHIGDYIGTESCGDLNNYLTNNIYESYGGRSDHQLLRTMKKMKKDKKKKKKKKEYPPPMTSLPFVLKRNSTSDGRLILTKEKVKRHEYLKAHRSNGRLTLELVVSLDDGDEIEREDVVGESSGFVENDHDYVVVEEDQFVHRETVVLF